MISNLFKVKELVKREQDAHKIFKAEGPRKISLHHYSPDKQAENKKGWEYFSYIP